jgi:starvation-inducible outer membrane lipoprotein
MISVVGRIDGIHSGKVDESDYTYPVLQAEQLYLWPRGEKGNTRFHFGIGVVFSG